MGICFRSASVARKKSNGAGGLKLWLLIIGDTVYPRYFLGQTAVSGTGLPIAFNIVAQFLLHLTITRTMCFEARPLTSPSVSFRPLDLICRDIL